MQDRVNSQHTGKEERDGGRERMEGTGKEKRVGERITKAKAFSSEKYVLSSSVKKALLLLHGSDY